MKPYQITYSVEGYVTMTVQADSKEEAIQLANGLCPVDTGDLEDCDWNVLDAQTCDSYSPERKPDQNNFPERQPL